MQDTHLSYDTLEALATAEGLAILGVTSAGDLDAAAAARFQAWRERGYAGEMAYMERGLPLFVAPTQLHPAAQSVAIFAVPYSCEPVPELVVGFGRVARYAWGLDYHETLKARMHRLVQRVGAALGRAPDARTFSDAVPLLEKELAARAGLGFCGKNSLLIRRGTGSYFFIAEVLWDLVIDGAPAAASAEKGCGSCTRCAPACPTGALVAPHMVDARRCISYLSIEKRGVFCEWEREALGEWVFGCDLCQECCPFNYALLKAGRVPDAEEFAAAAGTGPLLDLISLLSLRSGGAFNRRFAGTALRRARREGLLRNAACVAANTVAGTAVAALEAAFNEDASPVVRAECLAALCRLRARGAEVSAETLGRLIDRGLEDVDAAVRAEARLRASMI